MPVTLYRADREHPRLGHASWWTPDLDHARRYTRMPRFGGPVLYRTEVEPLSILDLRPDPWPVIAGEFGLDREDYGAGELDHELIWSLSRVLASGGYDWAVLLVGSNGWHDEWLYLGETELTAERIEKVSSPAHLDPVVLAEVARLLTDSE